MWCAQSRTCRLGLAFRGRGTHGIGKSRAGNRRWLVPLLSFALTCLYLLGTDTIYYSNLLSLSVFPRLLLSECAVCGKAADHLNLDSR